MHQFEVDYYANPNNRAKLGAKYGLTREEVNELIKKLKRKISRDPWNAE